MVFYVGTVIVQENKVSKEKKKNIITILSYYL